MTAGRPRATTRSDLALVAVRLFLARGFDETTVEEVALAAGVSRRTFFRYFPTKSSVLWNDFELEIAAIGRLLAEVPPEVPMMDAIRSSVVAANHYDAADLPELRARMTLIGTVPSLQAAAVVHYDAWERAIAAFVSSRLGSPPDSLVPLSLSRATLAVCRAAYDVWAARAEGPLTAHLDEAIRTLAMGYEHLV